MGSAHRAGWFRGECFVLPSAAPPLVAGATTFLHGKASHTILRSLALPYESCSLATPQAGAQQPVLKLEQLMICQARGALLSHRTAGWQGNTIRRGAKRPENRVTRFTPWRRWCRKAPKGEKRPKAANHHNAILAYESKGIKPESARSRKPEADSFRLYRQRSLPADRR